MRFHDNYIELKRIICSHVIWIIVPFLFVSLVYAQSTATLDDDEQMISQFEPEYKAIYDNITDLSTWKQAPENAGEKEVKQLLERHMEEIIRKTKTDETFRKKFEQDYGEIWKKKFIKILYKKLSKFSSDQNTQWNQEYLDLVQNYYNSQLDLQTYRETRNNFVLTLINYREIKNRIQSIQDVYKQNLQGVPTTYLIIGKREWNSAFETVSKNYSLIAEGAQLFVKNELSKKTGLIFSETSVKDYTITKDVIKKFSGGITESYEIDPLVFTAYGTSYVVHMYRCYPRFVEEGEIQQVEQTGSSDKEAAPAPGTRYENIVSQDFQAIIDKLNIKLDLESIKKYQNKIKELVLEVSTENQKSAEIIYEFDKKYREQMESIQIPKSNTEDSIKTLLNKIAGNTNKIKFDALPLQMEVGKIISGTLELSNVKGEEIPRSVRDYLDEIESLFSEKERQSRKRFEDQIRSRRMIILTNKQEYLASGVNKLSFNYDLLDGALETLSDRKTKLIDYDLTVIKEGRLVSYKDAKSFKRTGRVTRYIIVPPILTYIDAESMRLSLFLAQEIEFRENPIDAQAQSEPVPPTPQKEIEPDDGKSKSSEATPKGKEEVPPKNNDRKPKYPEKKPEADQKPDIIIPPADEGRFLADPNTHLEWMIYLKDGKPRSLSFQDGQRVLPEGFSIPTIEQLESLRAFLITPPKDKAAKDFFPLLKRKRGVWSRERSNIGNYYIYQFKDANKEDKVPDAQCYVIGVRPLR